MARPGRLTVEIPGSYTHTHTQARTHGRNPLDEGVGSSQIPLSTKKSRHKTGTFRLSAGFEPAIPALESLQNYALDRTVTGKGFIRSDPITQIFSYIHK
jgi:hypothetical protein